MRERERERERRRRRRRKSERNRGGRYLPNSLLAILSNSLGITVVVVGSFNTISGRVGSHDIQTSLLKLALTHLSIQSTSMLLPHVPTLWRV